MRAGRSLPAPIRAWAGTAAALGLAVGAALLLARALMAPSSNDLRALALYLALSGIATVGTGWLALRSVDRAAGMTMRWRAFLGSLTGAAVALLNVLIVARLMFLSAAHDLKLLIVLIAFSAVVTVFFSLWVAASVAGRLRVVADGIRALAAGAYEARVRVDGGDEAARLARDLNRLAGELQRMEREREMLEQERREFTAAVSHDLRTPLASVRAMVEALDDRVVAEPAEVARYYAAIRREIERLNHLIDDLFELARADAGALRLDCGSVALQEIAGEVVDAMGARARAAGMALALTVEGTPPALPLDGARIERAVANLVRNALEHTPAGGRVDVIVGCEGGWATLTVRDSGEGIAPADLPHIWRRFYRAEPSRTRAAGADDGAGLGLAIVRAVVEAHGGAVDVESAPGRGAVFTLRFPLAGISMPSTAASGGGAIRSTAVG